MYTYKHVDVHDPKFIIVSVIQHIFPSTTVHVIISGMVRM